MPQPLVIVGPDKYQVWHHLARVRIKHGFIAVFLIAGGMKLSSFVVHVEGGERSGIIFKAALGTDHLAHHALDQVADGHAGGDAVRVDD